MDHEAKTLLPDTNGTHCVSKSSTGWKFGLKFSCQSFSSLLASKMSWLKLVSLRFSLSLSQGCTRLMDSLGPKEAQRNSPTGSLHPRSSLVERTLSSWLWSFGTFMSFGLTSRPWRSLASLLLSVSVHPREGWRSWYPFCCQGFTRI